MYDVRIFDTAKVIDLPQGFKVEFVSVSAVNWSLYENPELFLPLNAATANIIRDKMNEGKEVYISKTWFESSEVLPIHLTYNTVTDIAGYKKRAMSFVKRFCHPQMANVNASVIYGFNVINNKFLEAGFVFSEENRSLKYIEVMEKADDLEEVNPEASEELMELLEKYIEYRETLDRSYFAWDLSEEVISKIEEVNPIGLINEFWTFPEIPIEEKQPEEPEELEESEEPEEPKIDNLEKVLGKNNSAKNVYFRYMDKEYLIVAGSYTTDPSIIDAYKKADAAGKVELLNKDEIHRSKETIDKIVKDYTLKLNTLNNLK